MPDKIDETVVRHIAMLARLKPDDDEVRQLDRQLSSVLTYIDQLNELDTTNVQPTAHALPIHNVLRADEPRTSMTPDQALVNAPQRDGQFFALPKVLDQDSA